jgi:hypothetical protein
MKSEVYKEELNVFVARTKNNAALLNQCQHDLKTATRAVINMVEKCVEVDGGIFEHLL